MTTELQQNIHLLRNHLTQAETMISISINRAKMVGVDENELNRLRSKIDRIEDEIREHLQRASELADKHEEIHSRIARMTFERSSGSPN